MMLTKWQMKSITLFFYSLKYIENDQNNNNYIEIIEMFKLISIKNIYIV